MKLTKVLYVDLDGTVRRSKSGQTFIKDETDIEEIPGIGKLLWRYREFGYVICGVSNQGGVAYGFKTSFQNELEILETVKLFEKNQEAGKPTIHPFSIIKCCFHHENGNTEPFNHKSLFRKPNYGMLAEIEVELFNKKIIVDYDNSIFVGDRPEDEQCAASAGIKFEWIDDFLNRPHEFIIK
jgi:D-glycero-D-manno-heptose 1,7-bisphosphate phosphatase